jgi:hypothetical protein
VSEETKIVDAKDAVYCGFIKAKFGHKPDAPLRYSQALRWASQFNSCRVTDYFVYIALGHTDLADNETAQAYIKSIDDLGGKITRLDFTIDILSPFAFSAYYEIMCGVHRGTPTLITSPRGDTVYIGRRSSQRFLRIYDKRAEIKARKKVDIGFDITRIELEVKRKLVSVYKRMFVNKEYKAILQDICTRYSLYNLVDGKRVIKPNKIADRISGPMAFVDRYKKVIRDAYMTNSAQFYETIGVSDG